MPPPRQLRLGALNGVPAMDEIQTLMSANVHR
jgi:hypothetical protein